MAKFIAKFNNGEPIRGDTLSLVTSISSNEVTLSLQDNRRQRERGDVLRYGRDVSEGRKRRGNHKANR